MGAITLNTPIQFNDDLPQSTDVVVIGGGVIGVSAALTLAEAGIKVVLCEKGRIAGEQSSRNWGWVRHLGRDADEMPIMKEAATLWQGMSARIGEDVGYRREGVIYLAETEARQADFQAHIDIAKAHDVPVELLDSAGVAALIKGRPGAWTGGLRCPIDGRAEPWVAVPAMARAAQRQGVVIVENCAVRGLDRVAGQVRGVCTERGHVQAQAVLLAGGAWTSLFLRREGVRFPQLSVRSSVARLGPAPDVYAGGACDAHLAFRRREDGGYSVALDDEQEFLIGPDALRFLRVFARPAWESLGKLRLRFAAPAGYPDAWRTPRHWKDDEVTPFERMRVLDPAPRPGLEQQLRRFIDERLPALAEVPIVQSWAGMIDAMPDVVPTMDAVPGLDGLWVAAGFSGHGFGIGPEAGRVMSDLIQGNPSGHDLTRFRFSRFSDGSPLRMGPAL